MPDQRIDKGKLETRAQKRDRLELESDYHAREAIDRIEEALKCPSNDIARRRALLDKAQGELLTAHRRCADIHELDGIRGPRLEELFP